MGGESSSNLVHSSSSQQEVVGRPRVQNHNAALSEHTNTPSGNPHIQRSVFIKAAFAGIWSICTPACLCPRPRSGQFCVFRQSSEEAYIGYGIDQTGSALNDLWCFNAVTCTWRQIHLTGDYISPRTGSRAFLYNNLIYVFGGYKEPDYFSCLHTINIDTGVVAIINGQGSEPAGRSTPVFYVYDDKVYIWGGYYSGTFPTELNIYDITNNTWRQVPQTVAGRTTANCVFYKNRLFSYGGARQNELLIIDLKTEKITETKTKGAEPPGDTLNAQMVIVENFAFFIGGRKENRFTFIYACDLDKLWWFVFHIQPDGMTVNTTDGYINEYGLFMVPCLHSFALFYNKKEREIVMTLGAPIIDPPPVSKFKISQALGSLHLRDDMLDVLRVF